MPLDHVRHPEWQARTTGATTYTGDLDPPGLLVAAVLRSPHPHARIVRLDTDAAAAMPGVHAVLTAADLPDRLYPDYGNPDRPALAHDIVRYLGQEVAAVAAESAGQAEAAVRAIAVRYVPLPAVTTPDAALRPDAPRVHDSVAANTSTRMDRTFGDAAGARAAVGHAVRGRFHFGMQAHACMEPHTVLASVEGDVLHVWAPTQGPRALQRELAHMLDLPATRVRVHRVAAGGDFGARVRLSDIEVITAALALRCGRPVRLTLDRAAEFAFTKHRHDFVVDLESGVDAHGRVVYRDADVTVDNGAFAHAGGSDLNYCSLLLAAQNQLDGAHVTGQAVYSNRRPGGAYRGAGGPQAVFAIESQMDELADALGIDPIEFRIANANPAGSTTITGWQIDSARLVECLRAVRDAIGWDRKRELRGTGRGVGVAVAMHVTGAVTSALAQRSEATVEIDADGRVSVSTGCADPGTGQPVVAAIVCAHTLGIDPADIDVTYQDTAETPYDPGAGASKGTFMTGGAALAASRAVADHLREVAADKFGVAPDAVRLGGGMVHAGADSVRLGDLVAASPDAVDGRLGYHREYVVDLPLATAPDGVANLSPAYSFAAQAVEVHVDSATGKVRVVRVAAVHDSGIILNPAAARGQVTGGVAMGIGTALGEELIFDDGRMVTASYLDYPLPRAADLPPVEVQFIEQPSARGPLGAKGLAEIAMSPTPAAVANAVAHATGVRVRDLPVTADKVLPARLPHRPRVRPDPRRWWVSAIRWGYPRGLHHLLHRYGTRLARTAPVPELKQVQQPATLADGIAALSTADPAVPLGGGTDLLVARQQGISTASTLVDLTGVPELTRSDITPEGDLVIGAAATLTQLAEVAHRHGDRAIADTIATIASDQIRNVATVAGNLCQQKRCWFFRQGFTCYKRGGASCPCYAVLGDHRFYHAALGAHRCQAVTPSDLATTLTALDAVVTVRGGTGSREIPVEQLYTGPGETSLGPHELITTVTVASDARQRTTAFEKLSLFEGGFAVVSVAVSVEVGTGGRLSAVRAVLGGIAPIPYRARETERLLHGALPDEQLIRTASEAWTVHAHPLPGNRWKVDAAAGLLARTIERAVACRPGQAEPAPADTGGT